MLLTLMAVLLLIPVGYEYVYQLLVILSPSVIIPMLAWIKKRTWFPVNEPWADWLTQIILCTIATLILAAVFVPGFTFANVMLTVFETLTITSTVNAARKSYLLKKQ